MTESALVLLPAVDVAGGRAVRLRHGEAGSSVEYGDALSAALAWQRAGSSWVHLVDIDAAFGRGSNAELIAAIVEQLDVAVQLSGGIHDEESMTRALSTGCARVNISTAALLDPAWVAAAVGRQGARLAIGLDVQGNRLVARGSDVDAGELSEVLATLEEAGCARYVVTDVSRDGALSGPNVELLRDVCRRTDRPVVASGGVGSLADVAALRGLRDVGVEGAVLGQALYTGRFTLAEALAVAGEQPDVLHASPPHAIG